MTADDKSTPWERAERSAATGSSGPDTPQVGGPTEPTDGDAPVSVADLMARLGIAGGEPAAATPRRRRRAADDDGSADVGVSAAALIASLGGAEIDDAPARGAEAGQGAEGAPESAAELGPATEPAEAAGPEQAAEPAGDPTAEAVFTSSFAGDVAGGADADLPPAAPELATEVPEDGRGSVINEEAVNADSAPVDALGEAETAGAHADHAGRGWLITARSFVAVIAILLLVASGTEWVIKSRADATLADNTVSAINTDDTNISPPAPVTSAADDGNAPAAQRSYEAENILIIGSDSRLNSADQALGGRDDSPGGSDVVMVAHMAADRSHVTIVSIPRDTYVTAPVCKAWDHEKGVATDRDYTTPYSLWRINSAYAAGGPPCTVTSVQELTGLRIDRVIIIGFSGFQAMVDALGGIEVNACTPIIDSNLGTVLKKAGKQHINGKQALKLVRARHVQGDSTSDLARIKRQQKVLSTILRQVTTAGVLLNPLKLDAVLQAFVSNVQSDNVTMDNLLDLAQSLGNLDPKRVTFFTLPTTPDENGVGLHPARNSDLLWAALRADEALPGEVTDPPRPTATSTSPPLLSTIMPDPVTSEVTSTVTSVADVPQVLTVAPREVDLQVVNVAGRGGVATQAKDALLPLGYRLTGPDLLLVTDDTRAAITVEYAPANREAALTVAATVPGASLVPVDGLGSKVRLMLGSSFDGSVRAVAVGDTVPSSLRTAAATETFETVSTVVTTPPPTVTTVPPTSTAASSTLADLALTSVNASEKGCI